MSASPAQPALFVSYAREDSVAAARIAEALRSHGIEVWFDQNELRGGEAWDQKIRGQLRTCALLIPIISANTQGRGEGYFRREWKLAAERTHDMAAGIPFLVPVVIDDTAESAALVPEEFMKVQWTRLPGGRTTPQFATQVKRLLEAPRGVAPQKLEPRPPRSGERGERGEGAASPAKPPEAGRRVPAAAWIGLAAVVVIGVAATFFATRKSDAVANADAGARLPLAEKSTPATPKIEAKSIAVLPFENLSAEPDSAYFADGMHEEVLTAVGKVSALRVIGRASVLPYADAKKRNYRQIAADLEVASVVEATVRRAGSRVRIAVQLIDARTARQVWGDTFERELTDVFAIQSAIAQEIAGALKASLTPDEREQIAQKPTQNQEAYDFYLRARALLAGSPVLPPRETSEQVIAMLERAVALDPNFALAYVQLAGAHSILYWFGTRDPTPERLAKVKAAADAAVRIAPGLPDARMAQGIYYYRGLLDFERALTEFRAAEAGRPNDAELLGWIALSERRLGRWTESLALFEKSASLNPRDVTVGQSLVSTLNNMRRYAAAQDAATRFLRFFPGETRFQRDASRARFELDGDVAAYRQRARSRRLPDATVERLNAMLALALTARDYPAAERILADPQLEYVTSGVTTGSVINEPVALTRALVAFLRGDRATAQTRANEALAELRAAKWSRRQEPVALMAVARAHALAGRADEALRDGRAAWEQIAGRDQADAVNLREDLGEIHLLLGRDADALAVLRECFAGASRRGPQEIRISPLWSRLQGDPRFEEILKSAKPL